MAALSLRFPRICNSTQRQLTSFHFFKAYHTPASLALRPTQQQFHSQTQKMSEDVPAYRANGDNGDDGSTEGEINAWKLRSPYRVHDNDPNFHVRYEGSCHCGKIRYQLSREKPLDAKYCHCHTCQKLHAAPFQWSAIFHKEDINFTHGHHDLGWYESSEKTCVHKLPCKVSCAYCRTPIMDEGRNMILLFPTLIDWKDDAEKKNFEPSCHMFYPRRVLDINDGKPKWTGINDASELIADSPPEAVKKRKRQEDEAATEKEEKQEDGAARQKRDKQEHAGDNAETA